MPSTQTDRLYGMTTSVAVKPPCRVATTAAITLSGEQTVNSVALVTGDRVLVKDQADTTENGIYLVDTSAWSRSPDFDGSLDAVDGTLVLVVSASGPDQLYELSATNPVIIGTSALAFSLSSLTATAFGTAWLAAADAAAGRVLLGFSTFFSSLIAAADAAAFRLLIGASTVGAAVFTAASAAVARAALSAAVTGANNDITSLTALTAGGLPDNSVLTADIADANITAAKMSGAQTGTAPVFGIRAWVNFNGSGTLAVNGSGNVSSVTDNNTGDYTVNFTTAMPSANYGVMCSSIVGADQGGAYGFGVRGASISSAPTLKSTTQVRVLSRRDADQDIQDLTVSIIC